MVGLPRADAARPLPTLDLCIWWCPRCRRRRWYPAPWTILVPEALPVCALHDDRPVPLRPAVLHHGDPGEKPPRKPRPPAKG